MKKFSFILLTILAVTFFSCDKSEDVIDILDDKQVELNNSVETVVASEEASETIVEVADYEVDLFSFVENEYDQPTGTKSGFRNRYAQLFMEWRRYKTNEMPEVSIEFGDNDRFPMTITINYGDSTVLHNGTIIGGTIQIELTASPRTSGAVREITFDLMIDSVAMEGTKRIEFTGEQGISRKWEYTSELTFTYPDDTELFRSAERTREWVAGLDTKWDVSDDRIEIKGSVTCVDTEQNEYSKVIDNENPLTRIGTCRTIVSGLVIFSQNQIEFASFDYGNGECDNIATYTYTNEDDEEVSKEVEIGRHKRHKTKR